MASVNTSIFIGRVTKDLSLSKSGSLDYVHFYLAVDNPFTKDVNKKVDFIPIVFWREKAQTLCMYTKKGDRLYIEGRVSYQLVKGKNGERDKMSFSITGRDFQFLTSRRDRQSDEER